MLPRRGPYVALPPKPRLPRTSPPDSLTCFLACSGRAGASGARVAAGRQPNALAGLSAVRPRTAGARARPRRTAGQDAKS